jgi:DNA polymerase-1
MKYARRCENCPLGGIIGVGSKGSIDAPIVFIGEGPGIDEISTGKPFTGRSGQLLQKVCNVVGISLAEKDAFITNALRCPQPKDKKFLNEAILACQPRLIHEITGSEQERQLLVIMGGTALKAITGNLNAKITRERGKIFQTEYGPAIATLHPAAILRVPKEFKTFYSDFKYIADIIKNGESAKKNPGETNFHIVKHTELYNAVTVLNNSPILSMDIETTGLNIYKDEIMCLGVAYDKNSVFIFRPEHIPYVFRNLAHETIVWHNAKFDTRFLQQIGIDLPIVEDVMLMHYVTDERTGTHGLKELSANFLGADNYEDKLKDYIVKDELTGKTTYSQIPENILFPYLAIDCDVTLQLYKIFSMELAKNEDYRNHYNLLLRASNFLREIENNGLYIDQEYLKILFLQLTEKLDILNQTIEAIASEYWDAEQYVEDSGAKKLPTSFNPASPKQLKWLLYSPNAIGIRVPNGVPQNTAEPTLIQLPEHPIITNTLEYRSLKKTLNTYVEGVDRALQDSIDDRIHPTFNLHTVETGRLSANGPNVQNFTRGSIVRNMVSAPDGRMLVEADFSQAELRCLAWYSRDENLIESYKAGLDLHAVVAEELYPGWNSLTDKNLKTEIRVKAKTINFGIAYGKTAESFAKEMNISVELAYEYIRRWFGRFPKTEIFLDKQAFIAINGGTLRTPFGRYRRFSYVSKETQSHIANEAKNFAIQSLASDLTLLSAMDMNNEIKSTYNGKIINIVHDSILVEVPEDRSVLNEVRDYIVDAMRNTPKRYIGDIVVFDADTKVGKKWGMMA